eukprot:CAMPEP_0171116980 /NCGR_PEP_ID=MMETSP0766_2-20121228/91476_1 /TAXON_ID=439317 /ORGANISM="Gambierdiscus australes, Strain CAWD 149" /LENGTH=104 /DNA_ID=CAMNT_0011579461 /DNA_START=91 /DNA_END=406 /DNA_ORIENTATION=+
MPITVDAHALWGIFVPRDDPAFRGRMCSFGGSACMTLCHTFAHVELLTPPGLHLRMASALAQMCLNSLKRLSSSERFPAAVVFRATSGSSSRWFSAKVWFDTIR